MSPSLRTTLEVGIFGGVAIVLPHQAFACDHGQVHGTVAKIDFGLPIVECKGSPWLNAVVMSHVAVGYGIALGHPMVGEIEVAVLAAIAPLQEAAIPVCRQGQLRMKVNCGADDAAHVAIVRTVLRVFRDFGAGQSKIAQIQQVFTARSLFR